MSTSDIQPNIYQLSGLDDRERGFTRQVECRCLETGYQALLRYERVKVEGHSDTDDSHAIQDLIKALQERGYTQLRSQLIFRGKSYLGSQELWVDYPDAEISVEKKPSLVEWIRLWFVKKKPQQQKGRPLDQC